MATADLADKYPGLVNSSGVASSVFRQNRLAFWKDVSIDVYRLLFPDLTVLPLTGPTWHFNCKRWLVISIFSDRTNTLLKFVYCRGDSKGETPILTKVKKVISPGMSSVNRRSNTAEQICNAILEVRKVWTNQITTKLHRELSYP